MGLGTMSQIIFVFPAQCGTRYISHNCLLNQMEGLRLSSTGTDLLYMQSGYLWWLQYSLISHPIVVLFLIERQKGKKGREGRMVGRKQWSEEVLWVSLVFWVMWMRRAGMGVLDQLGHRNLLCMTPKSQTRRNQRQFYFIQWNARGENRLGSQHCTFIICMQAELFLHGPRLLPRSLFWKHRKGTGLPQILNHVQKLFVRVASLQSSGRGWKAL